MTEAPASGKPLGVDEAAQAGWAAAARGDFIAAESIAEGLLRQSPDQPEGYQIGSLAARNQGRPDKAAAVLDAARERFPGQAWLLFEEGWGAFTRGDRVEALEFAAQLRARFPDNPAGYQLGAAAGRKLGWLSEATAIASQARERFPDFAWPLEEEGWTALARDDAIKAAASGSELRARFPENANGFWVGFAAARELMRFDEAAALLAEARASFPQQNWPPDATDDAKAESSPQPGVVALSPAHVAGARVYANRRAMIVGLDLPRHGLLVEVGVARGDFSDFLISLNDPIKFVAIDLFEMEQQPEHWGIKQEVLFDNMTHVDFYKRRFALLGDRIDVKRGWSHEKMAEIPDGVCDLIYIDADHGYENVIREAEMALRKIKPDGTIVFNDYTSYDPYLRIPYGVVKTVNEIIVRENLRVIGFALEPGMFCDIAVRRR
jgi:tetratricopeptide (TPR) repeat protein